MTEPDVRYYKLEKLTSNNDYLRTTVVFGYTSYVPAVGKPFTMVAESLTSDDKVRIVTTSEVTSVEEVDGVYTFHTLNSSYRLHEAAKSTEHLH